MLNYNQCFCSRTLKFELFNDITKNYKIDTLIKMLFFSFFFFLPVMIKVSLSISDIGISS